MFKFRFGRGKIHPDFEEQIETLQKFISLQRTHGKTIPELREILKEKGWPENHIREAVKRHEEDLKKAETPSPKVVVHPKSDAPMIRIDNVSKRFGNNQVLENVNLEIKGGDLVGIIGLSGSGKSTILNTVIGFYAADQGDVFFNHQGVLIPASSNNRSLRNIFGFAPQEPSFYRRLSSWENLDHFGSLYRINQKTRREFIDRILKQMGIDDARDTLGVNLSGGMQRRLSIACSLIHQPKILILDEPTADLDPYMRREIWNLIREINKAGTTVVLTSHFLSEVEGLCNKIAILHDKGIKAYGTPDELKNQYSRNMEISVELSSSDYGRIMNALKKEKLNISEMKEKGNRLVIYSSDAEKVLHHLIHHIEKMKDQIVDIELNKPSLDEIFESYIKKAS